MQAPLVRLYHVIVIGPPNRDPSVTLIGEAVFARCLSAIKDERVRASKAIDGPKKEVFRGDKQLFIDDLEQALYASKIISYTQGFMLMRETAKEASPARHESDRVNQLNRSAGT
jgi:6-phosphogluconate dehydrogenase